MSVVKEGYDFEVKAYLHNQGIIADPVFVQFYVKGTDIPDAYKEAEQKLLELFGNDDDGYDIFSVEQLLDEEEEDDDVTVLTVDDLKKH